MPDPTDVPRCACGHPRHTHAGNHYECSASTEGLFGHRDPCPCRVFKAQEKAS